MNSVLYLEKSGCSSEQVPMAKYIQQSFCCSLQNNTTDTKLQLKYMTVVVNGCFTRELGQQVFF